MTMYGVTSMCHAKCRVMTLQPTCSTTKDKGLIKANSPLWMAGTQVQIWDLLQKLQQTLYPQTTPHTEAMSQDPLAFRT